MGAQVWVTCTKGHVLSPLFSTLSAGPGVEPMLGKDAPSCHIPPFWGGQGAGSGSTVGSKDGHTVVMLLIQGFRFQSPRGFWEASDSGPSSLSIAGPLTKTPSPEGAQLPMPQHEPKAPEYVRTGREAFGSQSPLLPGDTTQRVCHGLSRPISPSAE